MKELSFDKVLKCVAIKEGKAIRAYWIVDVLDQLAHVLIIGFAVYNLAHLFTLNMYKYASTTSWSGMRISENLIYLVF